MRKVKYLVAALLLMGATTTFTSCIDNDEPAGITDLRGAKAELIRAKAAIAQAQVAMVQAQVANMEMQTKALEIANSIKEIELEKEKLNLAIAQANSEAEIARLQALKAQYEGQAEVYAETLKQEILNAQTATVNAQKAYELALRELEAARLVLSPAESEILLAAQVQAEMAMTELNNAELALKDAIGELEAAIKEDASTKNEADFTLAIEKLQLQKEAQELAIAEVEETLSKDISTYEGWIEQLQDWKDKKAVQDSLVSKINIAISEALNSDSGLEANAAYDAAKKAYDDAVKECDNVLAGKEDNDGNSYAFKLAKYEVSVNEAVSEILDETTVEGLTDKDKATFFDAENGKLYYAEFPYTQNDYKKALKANTKLQPQVTLANMLKLVGAVSTKAEDLAWANQELAGAKEILAANQKAYNDAYKKWEQAVEDFKAGKTYTIDQFKLATSEAKGVLKDIKDDKYEGESTASLQAAAYQNYMDYRTEMENNGQGEALPKLPTSVKDYATLKTALEGQTDDFEDFVIAVADFVPVDAKQNLINASDDAFGTSIYQFNKQPRLTAPTDAEIAEELARIKKGETSYADYGKIGLVWLAQYGPEGVTYYEDVIAQAESIKELKAALEEQQTKVNELVAENSAKVKPFEDAVTSAEKAVDAAQDAIDALTADLYVDLSWATAKQSSYQKIIDTIAEQLTKHGVKYNYNEQTGEITITDEGDKTADSPEEIANVLKQYIVQLKQAINDIEKDIEAENLALEAFKEGYYDKAYALDFAKDKIERRKADYEAAKANYDAAVARLQKVVEALSNSETPDETPDTTPDETPDTTPDETPDTTPEETPAE